MNTGVGNMHSASPPGSPAESPPPAGRGEFTSLLLAMQEGNPAAFDRLFSMAYQQMRVLARNRINAAGRSLTLDTTGLVHETYLKLSGSSADGFENSKHFFAVASRAMRQIIVDMARRHNSAKRGGGRKLLTIESNQLAVDDQAAQLCELDQHLEKLARSDTRLVRVIECRFFGGLSEPETARALAISVSTVQRDWIRAKAWFAANAGTQDHGPENV